MDYVWIVYFPPEYNGADLASSAISYILYSEPSQSLVDVVYAAGGTITKMSIPSGDVDVSVNINSVSVPLSSDVTGDYFTHPDDDYQQNIEIEFDGDETTTSFQYVQYQPKHIIVGNPEPGVPIFSKQSGDSMVYLLDPSTGSTIWSVDIPRAAKDQYVGNYNCQGSDDGICFFIDNAYPSSTQSAKVYRVDQDGNVTLIYDSGTLNRSSYNRFLCYDRALDRLHVWLYYVPQWQAPDYHNYTHILFDKAGSIISTEEGYSAEAISTYGIAAYNGDVWKKYTNKYYCNDVLLHDPGYQGGDPEHARMVACPDGYCYALYYLGFEGHYNLAKLGVSATSWVYEFPTATEMTSQVNLSVNDFGVSLCCMTVGGVDTTYEIDSSGNLVDTHSGEVRLWIDNIASYYKAT